MKILIVGREDSLIKSIAHRFYKEGHKVFILSENNVDEQYYKNYQLNSDSYKYDYIFKNTQFNIIIYINYRIKSNILLNILDSGKKYNTSQFIVVNLNERTKETSLSQSICKEYQKLYGLSIPIINVDKVYGDIDNDKHFLLNMLSDIKEDKQRTYDDTLKSGYTHILDLSEIIYLVSKTKIDKEYNIYGCEIATQKDIYNLAISIKNNKEDYKIQKNNSKEFKEFLDDTRFKEKFNLSKEVKSLYGIKTDKNLNRKRKSKIKDKNEFIKITKPYVENIGMFLIVAFISSFLENTNSVFTIVDLKLIYVIIIGMMHGMRQSIIAATLSCLLLISSQMHQGISIISIFVLSQSLVQILMYLLVGIYTGYASDFKNAQIKELKRINNEQNSKYEFLDDIYNSTYEEKKELEQKFISSKDSFGKIHSYIKELDSLKPQYILKSSIDIMEEFLENKNISIYTLNNNYLRLNVKSSNNNFNPAKSIKLDNLGEAREILLNKEIYINKSLNPNLPSMIAPIFKEGKVISIIMVDNVEFSKMNLYYQNLFKIIVSLIESAIIKAYSYKQLTRKERYINDTLVLKSKYFKSNLEICEASRKEKKSEYTLLKVEADGNLNDLSSKIYRCIRMTDLLGIYNGSLYIILNNTNKEESSIVINRLLNQGLEADIVDGVEEYA